MANEKDGEMNDLGRRPPPRTQTLCEVVDQLMRVGCRHDVTIGEILDQVGQRSYGPLLLVPGLLIASPLSAIPGLSMLGGTCIALVAGQILINRRHPWIPEFVRNRRIGRRRLKSAGRWLGKVARLVDRVTGPRLEFLTRGAATKAVAAICLVMAAAIPPLELVPMAGSSIGAVIVVYSLALTAQDGLLVLVALLMTGAAIAFIVSLVT